MSILPAFQASALRPLAVLKVAGGNSSARGFGRFGSRALLVGAEIAIALVLLAGAGLMLKSASRLQHTSIGVDPTNVLSAQFDLPDVRYDAQHGTCVSAGSARATPRDSRSRVRRLGLLHAGVRRLQRHDRSGFHRDLKATRRQLVGIAWATAGYFDALQIPVLKGRRNFTDRDRVGQPKVALVNETAARTYWPGESAIGKRLAVGQGGFQDGAEVVGVVGTSATGRSKRRPTPHVFLPLAQSYRGNMQIVVRSQLGARGLTSAISREVRALDPNLPLLSVKTMEERVGDAMWRTRVAAWLLSAFAAPRACCSRPSGFSA